MCLALPGQILALQKEGDLPMGAVDFSGVRKKVCLVYTPEAEVGDYVIVHVGFALSILDKSQAQATLDLINQVSFDEIRR
jgi:hydrogenase expression/formation protein HypC